MINPTWDLNLSLKEFKKVLRNPRDKRFPFFFARVLSRVPFREAFHGFITQRQFTTYYPSLRKKVDSDLLGAGQVPFWDWLYRRIHKLS